MISEAVIAATAAGIGAILTGIGALIVNIIKAKKEKTGDLEAQYSHTENLIKLMSGQTQSITQVVDQLKSVKEIINGVSKDMDRIDKKLENFHSEQKNYNIVMIRHDIVQTYETYRSVKKMPDKVWASTLNLYEIYRDLGGNSWISELIDEMRKWGKN